MKNVLVALMLALFIGGCGSDSTEYVDREVFVDRNITVYVDRNITEVVEVPVEVVVNNYVDRYLDFNTTLEFDDLVIYLECSDGNCTSRAGIYEYHMINHNPDMSGGDGAVCEQSFTQFIGVLGASTCSIPDPTCSELDFSGCDISNH